MLHMMADAVYVDMKTKEVVGLKPKAAFLPLFNLGDPVNTGELDISGRLCPKYLPPGQHALQQGLHAQLAGSKSKQDRAGSPPMETNGERRLA